MKRFTSLIMVLAIALLLAACSATVGTNAQLNAPPDHKSEVIGAISYGP